ncbi:MAG: hypothetical protein ACRDG9_02335 [Actinomycetota bacterium]
MEQFGTGPATGPRRLLQGLREFLHGMGGYEFSRHAVEMRSSLGAMFMTITLGDMVGVPVLPPYYSLRLLPYVVPEVSAWKRRVLRERMFGESHEYELHGM